jgi:trimethylamine--corrinoid protein Co-methyltransferase
VDLSAESQALDAIREVGPGSNFLACGHTLAHFESANFRSEIADNGTFEQWSAEGARWQHSRVNTRWKQMLAAYEPPPMDIAVREALDEFVTRRSAQINRGN